MGRKEADLRIGMQNPAWRDVLTGEAIEARPVEPVSLTSAQQGMPPERMCAQGNASYNPIVANTDEPSRAKNRRVDVVVLYPPQVDSVPSPVTPPSFP